MKLALMQPYLFPYVGYFQLIQACDRFVVYDDVQYMKGGWINRNRILVNGSAKWTTLPVEKDHVSSSINERYFATIPETGPLMLRQIEAAYRDAPFFRDTVELVRECLTYGDLNVARFVTQTLIQLCRCLQIDTPITPSSDLAIGRHMPADERVIAINKALGADHYINAPGGSALYDGAKFRAHGVELSFLRPKDITYRQFGDQFVPSLSIIDVLMFNSIEAAGRLLRLYDLVPAA